MKGGGIVFATDVVKTPVKKKTDRRSAFNVSKFLGKPVVDPKELVKKRRMSRMDLPSAPRRFTDDHPEIGTILQKPPIDRTSDEKKALFKVMRPLKAFQKFSDFTLGEVVGSLVLLEMEPNRAVFKQGMLLNKRTIRYINLRCNQVILVPHGISFSRELSLYKSRGQDESRIPFKLPSFMMGNFCLNSNPSKFLMHNLNRFGFGDLALVNEEPRAATILTKVLCQLVYIEKADFNRTVKFSQEKEIKEKILFLRKVEMLSEFTPPALKSLAQVVEWKRFQPGAIIQQQGTPVKNFYLIRSGEIAVLRTMVQVVKRKEVQVKIGTLRKYDYFGEEGVASISLDGGGTTGYVSDAAVATIMASKDGGEVEVGVMTCYDAKVKISLIAQNPLHFKTDGEVARLHQELIARRAWEKQKKRFFDDFAREKNIDPNMTADKWKKVQASAGRRKRAWI